MGKGVPKFYMLLDPDNKAVYSLELKRWFGIDENVWELPPQDILACLHTHEQKGALEIVAQAMQPICQLREFVIVEKQNI